MPTTPRIPKEDILEAALHILICEGFEAVNIKTIAKELHCSTQPISWHFGSMEKLRIELGNYAYAYADQKTSPTGGNALEAFQQVGEKLTDLAYDEPNLYKYLFLDGNSGYCIGGMEALTELADNKEMIQMIASENKMEYSSAAYYLESMIIYTVGILSLSVSHVLNCSKQEVLDKIQHASNIFLKRGISNETD